MTDLTGRLRGLRLRVFYDEPGAQLARSVLLPALSVACRYDRVSAYFNLASLLSIAEGLDRLRQNGGRMRLLMGLHDTHREIAEAAVQSSSTELFDQLRSRILEGVTSLGSELERDRVRTAAWMIADGLLEVKVVSPAFREGGVGIFHNKRLIFVDGAGDMITATGSVNETGAGLGANFEELTLHSSWAAPEYTEAHASRFETVWAGADPRLLTTPLDPSFARDLLTSLGCDDTSRPPSALPNRVVEVLAHSPFLGVLNSSRSPLYPHQERVLKTVCSRWPIRALLADEVGLGKTYEAAAIVSFALRHLEVNRVVVLAPPTLLVQWQEEFHGAFGIDFWRFDSSTRAYLAPDGRRRAAPDGPFRGSYPSLAIVSRELARGTRRAGHAFMDADLFPDLLVLDEAHAVRRIRSGTESRPSLVGRMMESLLDKVPHALFLTATPLQVDASELFDALELLGVPPSFDESAYLRSLRLLAIDADSTPELDQAATALDLLSAFVSTYGLHHEGLPPVVSRLIPDDGGAMTPLQKALAAQRGWAQLSDTLIRIHPAAQLCVRNTRETLSKVGYHFPAREFKGVECTPSLTVRSVLNTVDEYLNTNLGRVEAVLYPNKQSALGFVRSTYHQRAASSLAAIDTSLRRRLERLTQLRSGLEAGEEFVEEDSLDESTPSPSARADVVDEVALKQACMVEMLDIEALLVRLEGLEPDIWRVDPKLEEALAVVNRLRQDGRRLLVFSRYTDTVDALIRRYAEESGNRLPYASYTGEGGFLFVNGTSRKGDKAMVTSALAEGTVDVVFCSDAASEGLNLQAASAIVNVDVPWNPARLEQRIGRVARLGQTAASVDVINLWYPQSVEAKIYERVLSRKDVMELALGAFPEIVGGVIRDAVAGRSSSATDRDVVAELNQKRSAVELESLTSIWSAFAQNARSVGSADLRLAISEVLDEISSVRTTVTSSREPSDTSSPANPLVGPMLTLHEDLVGWLASLPFAGDGALLAGELGVLARGSKALTFALKRGGWVKALAPTALPDILRAVYLGSTPNLDDHVFAEAELGQPLKLGGTVATQWVPDLESVTIPAKGLDSMPPIPSWARAHEPVTFMSLLALAHP